MLAAAAGCGEQSAVAPPEPTNARGAIQAHVVDDPYVLRGAVVTPGGVLKHGYVAVVGGRITSGRIRRGRELLHRQSVLRGTGDPRGRAHATGIEDEVGALRAGLRADLLVLRGDADDAYGSVLRANTADVQLVIIDGVPLYGDAALMQKFWAPGELEWIRVEKASKVLATPAAGIDAAGLAAGLERALEAEGTSLAPLVETGQ